MPRRYCRRSTGLRLRSEESRTLPRPNPTTDPCLAVHRAQFCGSGRCGSLRPDAAPSSACHHRRHRERHPTRPLRPSWLPSLSTAGLSIGEAVYSLFTAPGPPLRQAAVTGDEVVAGAPTTRRDPVATDGRKAAQRSLVDEAERLRGLQIHRTCRRVASHRSLVVAGRPAWPRRLPRRRSPTTQNERRKNEEKHRATLPIP